MQSRVFHMCVPLAEGTDRLFPLEDLATLAPNVYEAAAAKYKDHSKRKALRDTAIPGLDKKWSQVVFLTPVDPRVIWRRWLDRTGEKLPPVKFWAIDPKGIDERSVLLERTVSSKGALLIPAKLLHSTESHSRPSLSYPRLAKSGLMRWRTPVEREHGSTVSHMFLCQLRFPLKEPKSSTGVNDERRGGSSSGRVYGF